MSSADDRPIPVGIALIARDGNYLVRKRPPGGAMPGVWEFPGGKVEPGESPEEATARECIEEIGLPVILTRLRRRTTHRYAHAWVELFYFDGVIADVRGEPEPETGFIWVAGKELPSLTFPEANEPVLAELAAESADAC